MALFDSSFSPYFPFGSRKLSLGDVDTDVALIQALSNLMVQTMDARSTPTVPEVPVNGRFDAETEATVRSLQAYFGLSDDGVAGPELYLIFGHGSDPYQPYGGPTYGSRPLSLGLAGGDVTVLQNRLSCFGYATILGKAASGYFDDATELAVAAFKQDSSALGNTGLNGDPTSGFGLFDATWLYTFAGGRVLFSGRSGLDVVFVQRLLQTLGFHLGEITGYYDRDTEAAVEAFQADRGLSVDGIVSTATFYHFGLANPHPVPAPLAPSWPATIVAQSSVGLSPLNQTVAVSFGVASVASTSSRPDHWLTVTTCNLPSPDRFGRQFTTYAFTLSDPATGSVSAAQTMLVVPSGRGTWAGTLEIGDLSPMSGLINVYPSNPSGSLLGSAVLEGDLVRS